MKNIVIVDYGLGNLYSIEQACIHVGFNPEISGDQKVIERADKLILPGVGAFGVAMDCLEKSNLKEPILNFAAAGKPLMGVCLGMQLLFDQSEEFGVKPGLGLIKGDIVKFPETFNDQKMKIPNIGWHKIKFASRTWENTPLSDIESDTDHVYFIHSYYAQPAEKNDILCTSEYNGFQYACGVNRNNIWGFQFHPEKSGEEGLSIYKRFLEI